MEKLKTWMINEMKKKVSNHVGNIAGLIRLKKSFENIKAIFHHRSKQEDIEENLNTLDKALAEYERKHVHSIEQAESDITEIKAGMKILETLELENKVKQNLTSLLNTFEKGRKDRLKELQEAEIKRKEEEAEIKRK